MQNKSRRLRIDARDTVRIVITGSHGVGKTTLAANLLATLGQENAAVVPETARLLVAEGFAVNDRMTLEGFLRYIHLFSENARRTDRNFIIFDRSLVDLYIYTRDNHSITQTARELLLELIRHELTFIDAYIIVPIEFAAEEDGVRPTDHTYQRKIDGAVRRLLYDIGACVIEVSGSVADRTRQVIESRVLAA